MEHVSKSKSVIIAGFGLLSLLVAVSLFALGILLPGESLQQNPPQPFSPSGTTGVMLALGPLITLWAITVKTRCTSRFIRNCIVAMAGLFVCWLLFVLLKYAASNESWAFNTFCWYYFYLPMIFAPSLALICALYESALTNRVFRILACSIMIISTALVGIVFTNSIHYTVFIFDYADPTWAAHYTYGAAYKVIMTWIAILVLGFFITILKASRIRFRDALHLIFVIIAILAIYGILYVLRVEVVFKSNFALTYILFFILLIELCLDFGIFPSFTNYDNVFRDLPYDVKVLDNALNIVHETMLAKPLPESAKQFLCDLPQDCSEKMVFTTAESPNYAFIIWRINGGSVIFRENRAEINAMTRTIIRERHALELSNKLLESTLELKKREAFLESHMEFVEEVRASLKTTFYTIEQLLGELRVPSASPAGENEQVNRKNLLKLRFLIAYSKRKSSLLLAERDSEDFDREKATLVINELAHDIRSAGIDSASFIQEPIALESTTLTVLYDCLYHAALIACDQENPLLLISTNRHDDTHAEVVISFECDNDLSLSSPQLISALCAALDTKKTAHMLRSHPHGFILSILIESCESQKVVQK